ncbi:NADH-quinone oxidoreductase subunit NuoF [Bosea sp. CS1GBMeth4]|uniref:formate dehydrogenase beta subunit n=1 Tax=Bosea sp. CS1GBMeth4 TaxID=1892849 RepID=UPI001645E23B|nr:NADH-quinone oxidoreductase subunit NuoF [Bosea sp. CS1GBMeth4]
MSDAIRIHVPIDAAALSVGAEAVAQAILREAQARGVAIELVRNGTRGMLWLEPLVEVETPDGRVGYGPAAAQDVASLFDAGFQAGGAHALRLGRVDELDWMKRQQRLTFARVGLTDPLSLADYRAHDGLRGLERALSLTGAAIVEEVTASGLRGRGGAGFPTGIKWRTVHDARAERKYIVCNADEGDSGTFADRMLMEGDPFLVIEGMAIAAIAVGATKGYIYLRSEYPHAHKTLQRAILRAHHAGMLGPSVLGSGRAFEIEVRLGAGAYICGEETSLLESLEGHRAVVRAKPPIPALAGLFGKPTIVNNVLSFAAVPWILAHGAEAYADYGMGRSRGTLPVQLGGNIRRGGLIELAFGIPLREIIEEMGGGTLSGRPIRAVQVGGPLGAYLTERQLDTPMDYEALAGIRAMLGHGGIVVFDDSVDMARQARFAFEFCARESCGKCTPCRIGATRGVELVDRIIAGVERPKNLAVLRDLNRLMTDASLCAMGGLTPMPVTSALDHFFEDFDRPSRPAPSPLAGEGWGEGSRDTAGLSALLTPTGNDSATPHPAATRPPSPARGEGEPVAERRT